VGHAGQTGGTICDLSIYKSLSPGGITLLSFIFSESSICSAPVSRRVPYSMPPFNVVDSDAVATVLAVVELPSLASGELSNPSRIEPPKQLANIRAPKIIKNINNLLIFAI
jgi:hypothetical protein